ncbi:hypothetical protein NX722_08110 [Endozoicomonas gorgoniicola]|uniref:Uncharacterized protein n=1 Tax=Endozoicomonas gorgoniicola TaxID=1234144 RepID=A0ABT3MUG2_9GAMM|nr:hypothetical protein [Endozoicomonas gorgoniicola]MCW7552614.1 hypothetical protein [Endozoicomonas gorgoniicola]
MGLEARVDRLESHFDALDGSVRSLISITGDTHQEILATRQEMREYQRENRIRFDQQERRMDKLESSINALTDATLAGFKRSDEQHEETRERFDQLELLIRQSFPKN